jgi:hypothetical protein
MVVENREVYIEDMVHGRERDYPINIEPIHWEKLKSYWFNFKTKKKVEQMSNTKNKVKNMGNVGQLCKTGKNAKLILVN